MGLAYAYDGDLVTGAELTGPVAGRVDRTYDADFRTAGVSVNGGVSTAYAYDVDGLLTAAGAMALARDAANGQVTGTTLGVVTDERTYNEHGEPTGYLARAGGTAVLEAAYTRDGVGRITAKTETIQGTTANYAYFYDVAGRLVRVEKNGVGVEQYAYDANGNRTSGTVGGTTLNGTYDGDDKVALYGGAAYAHAAGGEWRTVTEGGVTTTYDYDAVGNLRGVTLPSGTTLEYVIDGRNRRVGRKVNDTLTQGYLYDGQLRIVAELDGANNVTARYVYGTRPNVPEWLEKGGQTYRIITDHLGSPRLVVNATSGAIVQRMDYDSWGNITNDTSPGFQIFGYAGGLHDQETKLTRYGARDYDAHTGRWTAKDPIGFNGGSGNLYEYVHGDPVNKRDPQGEAVGADDALAILILTFPEAAVLTGLAMLVTWGVVKAYDYWANNPEANEEKKETPVVCPNPQVENQRSNPPPVEGLTWDSKRNRWVDAEGNVYTRHNWGPEKPHWDKGFPSGKQEKSYDGRNWEGK
ncbi:MAG: hypothetical protein IPH01_07565 [Elusimicrobia bacterium]|nr:hypothetical protein [Elusimicrobiota bacterium]